MQRKSQRFPREKKKAVVSWLLRTKNRSAQRRALALKWLQEGQYTKYRYNVERCADGSKVYLLRPTWLNKGFDFQVNLEGFRSKTRKSRGSTAEMPSHKDVLHDLRQKIRKRPRVAQELFEAISHVYDCVEPDTIIKKLPRLRKLRVGLPPDTLLKILKCLFIEQDLTYWLQTGRNMLMSSIEEKVFRMRAPLKE
jgi:hypothetical protein